jgi:Phosphopantetheine attachment site.
MDEETNFRASLARASSVAEAGDIVTNALANQFCRMILISRAKLNVEEPLHVAGADSLSAVDLRNWIMKKFGVDMPVFDILGEMSVTEIGKVIAKEWKAAHSNNG